MNRELDGRLISLIGFVKHLKEVDEKFGQSSQMSRRENSRYANHLEILSKILFKSYFIFIVI